jgi:uncharacterized membrane protein
MLRRHKPYVLVTLPVVLVLLLVAVTVPVVCTMSAAMSSTSCTPSAATPSMPSNVAGVRLVTHTDHTMPAAAAPASRVPAGHLCQHAASATKAIAPEALNLFAAVTALVALVLFVAPAAPRVARVVLEPSPPPGLVLATTAVIRI